MTQSLVDSTPAPLIPIFPTFAVMDSTLPDLEFSLVVAPGTVDHDYGSSPAGEVVIFPCVNPAPAHLGLSSVLPSESHSGPVNLQDQLTAFQGTVQCQFCVGRLSSCSEASAFSTSPFCLRECHCSSRSSPQIAFRSFSGF